MPLALGAWTQLPIELPAVASEDSPGEGRNSAGCGWERGRLPGGVGRWPREKGGGGPLSAMLTWAWCGPRGEGDPEKPIGELRGT